MKTIEERVQILEGTVESLRDAFLTSQSNQAESQGQIDNTTNKVDRIEPTTYTKTAYIGDTEVVFTNVPSGNLTIYVMDSEGKVPSYTVERASNSVRVVFEFPLVYITTVTISIL